MRSALRATFGAVVGLAAMVAPLAGSVQPALAAAAPKVVVIVGPVGGTTASYRSDADAAAAEALKYTPNVVKLYSPNATWDVVKPALQGASIVPVPAHPSRRRRHGFNPAAAIAGALCSRLGLPLVDALAREGSAAPQVGLQRGGRLSNAHGSVRLRRLARRGGSAPGGRLLLVDDVYTTGATLDACAQALGGVGAETVAAVTFARAVRC